MVLLSGGLDSSTVLAIARDEGLECHCLTVDYGQRHRIELEAARAVAAALGAASHRVIGLDLRAIGGSALTDDIEVPKDQDPDSVDVPVTYVPARNTIMLSLLLGLAFLTALTALGAGLGVAVLGALLALWQVLRGVTMPRERQVALLCTAFVVLYVAFSVMDSLGFRDLAGGGRSAFTWGLFLLCLVAGIGAAAWFLFSRLFRVRGES